MISRKFKIIECFEKNYFFRKLFEDMLFWSVNDLKLLKKIFQLIEAIRKNPFEGLGKPEALKYEYKGYWSRRINEELVKSSSIIYQEKF